MKKNKGKLYSVPIDWYSIPRVRRRRMEVVFGYHGLYSFPIVETEAYSIPKLCIRFIALHPFQTATKSHHFRCQLPPYFRWSNLTLVCTRLLHLDEAIKWYPDPGSSCC
ncbi:hypothetical protein LR48_Vigan707s003100 [Vigna angularis]|uniref:Uncharacterized protein n=2 Tax=Phaseolus angularis TaxID=3914 RepID=A0A0L9TH89_PHAAN|nr:hypothetical protein LR48_Vigan707s003100 [Vigna angularis]BAT98030.1 hypothetical protein VIGAN_09163600 [Vigna angularis var. angularis]